jgi:hypothetical protein
MSDKRVGEYYMSVCSLLICAEMCAVAGECEDEARYVMFLVKMVTELDCNHSIDTPVLYTADSLRW